jgi:3-mercaptopyruvate sulfurtransferase SseA
MEVKISNQFKKGGLMKSLVAGLTMTAISLWGMFSFAQEQRRYPVDPQTKWAVGATPKPADELKKQLDSGSTVLIIDVRQPASFEKETIPGAINIPLADLEGHLKMVSKDTFIVFT